MLLFIGTTGIIMGNKNTFKKGLVIYALQKRSSLEKILVFLLEYFLQTVGKIEH